MQKCICNGQYLYADKVKKDYILEKKIRTKKEKCYCPECGERVYFKNGKKKEPHFCHYKVNIQCEYAKYEKTGRPNTPPGKIFIKYLTQYIQNYYPIYDVDHKIKNGLWVNLANEKSKIAIDVVDILQRAKTIEKKYQALNNYTYIRFVMTDINLIKEYDRLSFQEKSSLENGNKILYAVDNSTLQIKLIKKNRYNILNGDYFKLNELDFNNLEHEKYFINIDKKNEQSNKISIEEDNDFAKYFHYYCIIKDKEEKDFEKEGLSAFKYLKMKMGKELPKNLRDLNIICKVLKIEPEKLLTKKYIKSLYEKENILNKEQAQNNLCKKCGQPKEYKNKDLCRKCYYESKGLKLCKKCNKPFYPKNNYHIYCYKCFTENQNINKS